MTGKSNHILRFSKCRRLRFFSLLNMHQIFFNLKYKNKDKIRKKEGNVEDKPFSFFL